MLLFIYILAIKYTRITRFNTSHVTLYPHGGRNTRNFIQVSIHLMLLFIVKGNSKYQKYDRFNTSHVTLYPTLFASPSMENMFQYISCYSLSASSAGTQLRSSRFNTSHVTLYRTWTVNMSPDRNSFNTSHVTLYLWNIARFIGTKPCFNTSHVTLYPSFYRLFFF